MASVISNLPVMGEGTITLQSKTWGGGIHAPPDPSSAWCCFVSLHGLEIGGLVIQPASCPYKLTWNRGACTPQYFIWLHSATPK